MQSKNVRYAITALATAIGLSACGPSRDNWQEAQWTALCKKWDECYDDSEYYSYFDDVEECVDVFMEYADFYGDYYDDCDYDRGAARACLSGYKKLPCDYDEGDEELYDEVYDDCDSVWDCSN